MCFKDNRWALKERGRSEHSIHSVSELFPCSVIVDSPWVSGQGDSNKDLLKPKIVSVKFPTATESTKDQRFCDSRAGAAIGRGADGSGCFIVMIMLVTWPPLSTLPTDGIACDSSGNALESYQRWKEFLWGLRWQSHPSPTETQSRGGERRPALPQHQRGTWQESGGTSPGRPSTLDRQLKQRR